MPLIPASALAVVFFCAAGVCLLQKHFEHAFTRLSVAIFYGFLVFYPETPLEITRNLSRYLWFLLAFIEIFSYFATRHYRKRVK